MDMGVGAPLTFGQLLRRYRATVGLTQEELAERAGLSGRGIADLERGARAAPYPQTVRRLADALGLSQEERTAFLTTRSAAVAASHHQDAAHGQAQMSAPLPLALSTFVGRDADLDELSQLLRTARSVTGWSGWSGKDSPGPRTQQRSGGSVR